MADNETDKHYMSIALSLAEKGRGKTSPNPMVGAVVVRDGSIAGQDYHHKAGEAHAEVIALGEAGENTRGATLYVTLEPCCHHGKTPPCTDVIIKSGIRRVVTAMIDENPLVAGGGCDRLREAGIDVKTGILEDRARKLNEAYLKFITIGAPFLTLKLAVTLDGRIADTGGKSKWITGAETRKRVHRWRAWSDAVMVGVGTVLTDNPALTVRDADGSDPLRIVVDSHLRTPPDAKVIADSHVVIAVTDAAPKERLDLFKKSGAGIWIIDSKDGRISLAALLKKLGEKDITSVLCEGGGILATSLLAEKLVDKIIFTFAPKILGSGKNAVGGIGIGDIDNSINLKDTEVVAVGDDIIITGYPEYD